jgi:lysophospholipase L1-like esterase
MIGKTNIERRPDAEDEMPMNGPHVHAIPHRNASLAALLAMLAALAGVPSHAAAQEAVAPILPDNPNLQIVGRYDLRDALHPRLGYPGTGLIFRFEGVSARLQVSSDSDKSALTVVVDHGVPALQLLRTGANDIDLTGRLQKSSHTVEIYKRTEAWQGILTVQGVQLPDGGTLLPPPPRPSRTLMFVGDSVTCGAGLQFDAKCTDDPAHPSSDAYDAYGMLLGRRLDAQSHLVCYGGRGLERDYRGLGEADGVLNIPQFFRLAVASDAPDARAPWDAARWQPDAIVVSLGTNDFNLQKTKPLDEKKWVAEYVAFVRELRKDYPHAVLLLTEGSIVTDPLLRQLVQQTVAEVHNTEQDAHVQFVPSNHYPGNGCNGHPTQAQHLRIADDLEPAIRTALGW